MAEMKRFEDVGLMLTRNQKLYDLLQTGAFSDLTLETTDKHIFKVHKNILAATSTYFWDKLHSAEYVNASNLQENIKKEHMDIIAKFIYTGCADFSKANTKAIYIKAKLFKLDSLMQYCTTLLEAEVNNESCLYLFKFAVFNQSDQLIERSLRHFCQNNTENFIEQLTNEEMVNLIGKKELINSIENQEDFLQKLINWIKEDFEKREYILMIVMRLIDFKKISNRFITTRLLNDDVLRRNQDFLAEIMRVMFDRMPH